MNPFIWLGVAVVMGVVEAVSLGLVMIWFVVGALDAFVASLLGADLLVQTAVFLAVSVACLVLFRPVFVRYRDRGKQEEPTNIGMIAVVCERIDNDRQSGRVETPDHMTWAARSADDVLISEGENVVVVGQDSRRLIWASH